MQTLNGVSSAMEDTQDPSAFGKAMPDAGSSVPITHEAMLDAGSSVPITHEAKETSIRAADRVSPLESRSSESPGVSLESVGDSAISFQLQATKFREDLKAQLEEERHQSKTTASLPRKWSIKLSGESNESTGTLEIHHPAKDALPDPSVYAEFSTESTLSKLKGPKATMSSLKSDPAVDQFGNRVTNISLDPQDDGGREVYATISKNKAGNVGKSSSQNPGHKAWGDPDVVQKLGLRSSNASKPAGSWPSWVSCTAIMSFCTRDIGVIAVDSRSIDIRDNQAEDDFNKFIFLSPTIMVAATGVGSISVLVEHALPGQIGNTQFDTVPDTIQNVINSINNVLIPRHRDYRLEENTIAFVMLCLVNGRFGIARIHIDDQGSQFIGEWQNSGFINGGCGERAIEEYQATHPIDGEININDADDVGGYAISCIIAVVDDNPVACGGDIQTFVIRRREGFSSWHVFSGYPDNPHSEVENIPHQ